MPSRESVASSLRGGRAIGGLGAAAILLTVWAAAVPRPARTLVIPGRTGPDTTAPPLDAAQGGGEVSDGGAVTFGGRGDGVFATVLAWGAVLLLVLVAVVAAVLVARALVAWWRRRRRPPDADPTTGPDLDVLLEAVVGDAEGRLTALSAGTPAEGIIAAWSRLESTLHEVGMPLTPSRTSSEVTVDVLSRFAVSRDALLDLAALFREARFSRHELTEDDRSRAATAYRALAEDLVAVRPSMSGTRRG